MERLAGYLEQLFPYEKNQLYMTLLGTFVADIANAQNTATFVDKVCKSIFVNTTSVVGLRLMTRSYVKIYGKGSQIRCDYTFDNIRSTVYFTCENQQENEFVKICLFVANNIYNAVKRMESYEKLVSYDPLTGAYARRVGLNIVRAQIARSKRQGTETFVVFLDLDNFKLFNDTYGHIEGDKLLEKFGEHVRTNLRQHDLFIRYGGDEFVLFLETASPEMVMERLLKNSPVSFSYGIASTKEAESLKELLEIADRRMYDTKKARKSSL